ncbi:hypothetical protein VOLCADRAFT_96785 [Volvox carteri f. nagariensis]|uniref:Peptidase A2 domain-containing protein n=1 Tax=Volvox carteri f. nagariensis TaxID=3068 RepID=D8UB19_VOLCA|nr:uncharacterized protein VOLCADRAFT_96785 [Volvox carteri f. nagariensis]EFJ43093.1 hypothetical protein VOLCADRAFT_96785 [Volvox carteri f. nagariensis]|eukprot:XP_002955892.1 hypothetical protein VOLCADRAFT_96785 [Volvox carteri f. nagariensis]
MMRRTPFTGGCLLRRAASRPPQFAAFPWISFRHHGCCANKLKARASTLEDRTGSRQSVALEHVLEELRKAQGIDKLGPDVEAVVSGRGKHLGIAVSWSLRWTASGSFTEEIRGPQLTFKWGYDGRKDGGCWEDLIVLDPDLAFAVVVDSAGLVRVMECDDHEAVLMTTYIRTATHISSGGSGSTTTARGRKTAAVALTHGAPGSPAADEVVAIGLRVRGRKLRVRVFVRRRDWRLLGFNHRMCADVEMWELGEWKEWAEGVSYPSSALHKASNGGQHAYLTNSGAAERVAPLPPPPPLLLLQPPEPLRTSPPPLPRVASAEAGSLPSPPPPQQLLQLPPPTDFGLPLLPPIPGDTSYSPPGGGGGQGVPLWRAASGHYLVRPTINGQEGGGYFVVDTGASGFVLTPQAAARLGGQSFGETHAASISGKVAARFVRLGSWSLGGLSIRQPVLMVMALEGLVRGAPGEVVGIVGHDLFSRDGVATATATAHISSRYAGSGAAGPVLGPPPPAARSTAAFEDPVATAAAGAAGSSGRAAAAADGGGGGKGHPIANLPHVHLRFADPGGGAPHAALLMVDSGACGADLMLHARAQKELGLMQMPPAAAPGAGAGDGDVVVGGGGSSNGSRSEGHYLRGVGQDPKDYVQLQVRLVRK